MQYIYNSQYKEQEHQENQASSLAESGKKNDINREDYEMDKINKDESTEKNKIGF